MGKIKDDLKIKSKRLSKSNAETVLEYHAVLQQKILVLQIVWLSNR
jgi:hypothetical protein